MKILKKLVVFSMVFALLASVVSPVGAEVTTDVTVAQTVEKGEGNTFNITLNVTSAVEVEDSALMIVVDKSSSMDDHSPILLDSDLLAEVVAEYPELTGISFPTSFGATAEMKTNKVLTPVDEVLETIDNLSEGAKEAVYACYHVRAWFQRKAVIALLDEYTKDTPKGTTRYVSFAYVAESAKRNFSWTEIGADWKTSTAKTNDSRKGPYSIAEWVLEYNTNGAEWWTTDNPAYTQNVIFTYTNGSGSNLEAGYKLVANNMALDTIANVPAKNRHVIMFTDGELSCKIAENADTTSVTEIKGDRNDTYDAEDFATIETVVKDESFNMNVVWYGEASLGNSIFKEGNYADKLEDISGSFVEGNDGKITEVVANIADVMVMKDHITSMKDTLADNVKFISAEGDAYTYDAEANTITWDLTRVPHTTTQIVGNGKTRIIYEYVLKYVVGLDDVIEEGVEYPISNSFSAAGDGVGNVVVNTTTEATIIIEKEETTEEDEVKAPETGDVTNVAGLLTMLVASAYVITRRKKA